MFVRNSAIVWSSVALIILSCNIDVDAAKTQRRGNKNKTPNRDHVALSYGRNQGNAQHQSVQPQQHAPIYQQASAPNPPALPTNNNQQSIGWKEQPKVATNTHSAMPYPQNPPAYTPHASAGPPPPYSATNTGYNPQYPAGNPPPYSQHPNPPAYSQQPTGQYPHGHDYPQQTYANPIGGYNQGGVPGGAPNYANVPQQPAVTNNFYSSNPQPASSGGGGGGFLQTALAAGAGSIAGNALYDAIKPASESKTVVIHENAAQPSAAPAAAAPAAPVASAAPTDQQPAAPVVPAESTTAVPVSPPAVQPVQTESRIGSNDSAVPLAPIVPLAPLPDQQTDLSNVSLAPMPTEEVSSVSPVQQSSEPQNQTFTPSSSSVPLAAMPTVEPSSQAQKGSANSFAIFNISAYTIISILIASIF